MNTTTQRPLYRCCVCGARHPFKRFAVRLTVAAAVLVGRFAATVPL